VRLSADRLLRHHERRTGHHLQLTSSDGTADVGDSGTAAGAAWAATAFRPHRCLLLDVWLRIVGVRCLLRAPGTAAQPEKAAFASLSVQMRAHCALLRAWPLVAFVLLSTAVVMGVRQRGRRLVIVMRLCQMADIMHEVKLMRVETSVRPQLPPYPGKGAAMQCTRMKKDVRLSSVAEQKQRGPSDGLAKNSQAVKKTAFLRLARSLRWIETQTTAPLQKQMVKCLCAVPIRFGELPKAAEHRRLCKLLTN